MGYEEVETVLPADFVPQPDPVPEPPTTTTTTTDTPAAHSQSGRGSKYYANGNTMEGGASDGEFLVSDSEPESEAEDAGCAGRIRKKKKKKKRRSSSGGRGGGRKSLMGRWRASRSKSRGRKKKDGGGGAGSVEDASDAEKEAKKKGGGGGGKSGRGRLSFRTIKKVDSNATEIMSNTSKKKLQQEKDKNEEPKKEEENKDGDNNGGSDDKEVSAINSSAPLPTVREGSPANTTITALTGDGTADGIERAVEDAAEVLGVAGSSELALVPAEQAGAAGITAPSPAPTVGTELSIEVGDENEQFEVQVDSPFNAEGEEVPATAAAEESNEEMVPFDTPFPSINTALSRESARSAKSNRSTLSSVSNKSGRSARSNRSVKSAKSGERAAEVPDVAAAPSTDAASVRSTRSNKSAKSARSTSSAKSNKSARSNKSTSSKRSLRSIKLKKGGSGKAKDEAGRSLLDEDESAIPAAGEEDPAPAPAPAEENTSDKENARADPDAASPQSAKSNGPSSSAKGKWVKKVSLSIGGYKTSFQFSDPMSNLADAVNDALDVVGDGALAEQAKELDAINPDAKQEEEDDGEEEVRDYDEDPTRLFMYLQQRAWGLALTQLQANPSEARVWVYRRAKPEKAPDVDDASRNPGAVVVQHSAMVVHDGNEAPRFRWKLLPLHAAIVLGAPTEIIQDIVRAYPNAARKTDERGSLPVHLAASRLDVDPEGEKVVLQLFGAYPDSIELQDRKGRTPPELAKLARARKEIEERRRRDASSVCPSQMGVEQTASVHEGMVAEKEGEGEGGSQEDGDADDDTSVKSSLSGKFKQIMLRKARSSDTHDRRKKKMKKKKEKKNVKAVDDMGLSAAKSMGDTGCDEESAVDDATIAESLGPGFAFVKTSEAQEKRERTGSDDEDIQVVECARTEEEILKAAKKAIISREYQVADTAPMDVNNLASIPLPMSFSMGDDNASVASSRSSKSAKSSKSIKSRGSSSPSTKGRGSFESPRGSISSKGSKSSSEEKPIDEKTNLDEDKTAVSAATKSVTISNDEPQVQEIAADIPDAEDAGSDESPEQPQQVNEGLRALLEKAVENAGKGGVDVTPFVKTLGDEWVNDVEALRRLDGETLDELLPLMLSRELQRLIGVADGIDSKFLKEDRQALAGGGDDKADHTRGRSPKKSSKKKKKKRSHRRAKKRSHYRPVTPPEGPLTPISEEVDSPASANSDGHLSVVTEARSVYSAAKTVPPRLAGADEESEGDDDETADYGGGEDTVSEGEHEDDEDDEDGDSGEGDKYDLNEEEGDIAQSASIEDLEIRKLHANLIADARKKFPTREALEDSIRERQAEVEAAVNSGFDVDKETLARAALADDEVRKLLPLRLILPTVADLTEMIGVLQMHKEGAIRDLDMEKANSIQGEIDELQEQIDREERYLLKKRMGETKCTGCGDMFPTEKKMKGVLRTKQKRCWECREGSDAGSVKTELRADIEAVDSRDDDEE